MVHSQTKFGAQALQLRLAAQLDRVAERHGRERVVGAVVLHLVDDRRVRALRVAARERDLLVGLDAGLDRGVDDRGRAAQRVLGVVPGEERAVQVVLVLLEQILRVALVPVVRLRVLVLGAADRAAAG